MKHILTSPRATRAFASQLAKRVLKTRNTVKHATVVALSGELGAGKTVFAKAFAAAFHVKHRMPSPTFLIVRSYPIPHFKKDLRYRQLFHLDLYRLHSRRELAAIGFSEIMKHPEHVVLIEWPERVPGIMPRGAIRVQLDHGKKKNERSVALKARGW